VRASLICSIALLLLLGSASAASTRPDGSPRLTLTQAAVLGLVEGITEYLPISSTGHLILAQRVLGIGEEAAEREAAAAYVVCIQLGAIVAVLLLYRSRVRRMLLGMLGQDVQGRRLAICVLLAFLPAAVAGLLLEETIKERLFGLEPIGLAWLLGGLAILVVARWRRGRPPLAGSDLAGLDARSALLIGLAQCAALWPGTSRSLATIVGGLLVGLSVPAAVEFSFLLGLVTLGAATSWDLLRHGSAIVTTFGWQSPLLGFVVAGLAAFLAVKWMVAYLERHGLEIFGWYRVGMAALVGLLLLLD